jgi:hypothetical protein
VPFNEASIWQDSTASKFPERWLSCLSYEMCLQRNISYEFARFHLIVSKTVRHAAKEHYVCYTIACFIFSAMYARSIVRSGSLCLSRSSRSLGAVSVVFV